MIKLLNVLRKNLLFLLCFCFNQVVAQDSTFLKVHFLYGSKPLKEYKDVEQKWFGGMPGGHVGIESDSGKILSFLPIGKFHWFAKKQNKHSTYLKHSYNDFYSILGGNPDCVKKAIVFIPITIAQKQTFDSIATVYLKQTPYDYAFIGMRCGAATYEILGRINILPKYSTTKISLKIFYPAKLRRQLFQQTYENNWNVLVQQGTDRRKWEKD